MQASQGSADVVRSQALRSDFAHPLVQVAQINAIGIDGGRAVVTRRQRQQKVNDGGGQWPFSGHDVVQAA